MNNKKFCCVFVGSDMNKKNKILFNEIKRLQLDNYVKLLGPKKMGDIFKVMFAQKKGENFSLGF